MSRSVVFNGKFLCAESSGVHKVAHELITAYVILAQKAQATSDNTFIFAPRNIKELPPSYKHLVKIKGLFTGQLWEQIDLPLTSRESILISLCNLAPLLHQKKTVVMIHDAQVYITPESYSKKFLIWYRFVFPIIGRSNLKIVTVSNFSKEQLVKYSVAKGDKIEVIYNGVDHVDKVVPDRSVLQYHSLGTRKFVVALSNTQKHKNISLLLRVFAREEMKDIKLVLIGSDQRARFVEQGHVVPNNVIFTGRISDEQLKSLIAEAACVACPSLTEGFGLLPLEGMYLGCPAIVAPCGALPEVCGSAALYAAPDDVISWSEMILKLSGDQEYFSEWSRIGSQHARSFTWERAAYQLHKIVMGIRD